MLKILLSVLGTLGFTITLNAPKDKLLWCFTGAFISAGIYESTYAFSGAFISTLLASFFACAFSELAARIKKAPSTVFILPSTIPLLPGSSLYYAMNSLIGQNISAFRSYLTEAGATGLGIATGTLLCTIGMIIIKELKERL